MVISFPYFIITTVPVGTYLRYILSSSSDTLKFLDRSGSFTDRFPAHSSLDNVYGAVKNNSGWNQGFWTGILWHAYELTGEHKYKNIALLQIPSYYDRIKNKVGVNHHDMGFLFTPSCVAAYKLTENEQAKEAAIMAADHLITRYHEKGEFIQAWGNVGEDSNYRLIVDCLMNIPLLYWASEVTGDSKYRDIAFNHYNTTLDVSYREDGSTYHTYYFDYETGEPLMGVTHQGASDDSTWSRGQSWGIYGFSIAYSYTHDTKIMEAQRDVTYYMLNHLPEDLIPYWDYEFTSGDESRDSSAAAIAVCGMLDMAEMLPEDSAQRLVYESAAAQIMEALIDKHTGSIGVEYDGLINGVTHAKPQGHGIEECAPYADYFYLEALARYLKDDFIRPW